MVTCPLILTRPSPGRTIGHSYSFSSLTVRLISILAGFLRLSPPCLRRGSCNDMLIKLEYKEQQEVEEKLTL